MIGWIIGLVLWAIGGVVAYNWKIKFWDNSKFEKIWFSCFWPLLIPLYVIHYIHNHHS